MGLTGIDVLKKEPLFKDLTNIRLKARFAGSKSEPTFEEEKVLKKIEKTWPHYDIDTVKILKTNQKNTLKSPKMDKNRKIPKIDIFILFPLFCGF